MSDTLILKDVSTVDHILQEAITEVGREKFGANFNPKHMRQLCLHDGTDKADKYDGFEGMVYVSASNDAQPTIVDRDGRTPLTKASGKIYSGCRVVMYVSLWAQDNKYGKGVNATLRGVQFYRDDVAFSGGAPLGVEGFESFEDEAEEKPATKSLFD